MNKKLAFLLMIALLLVIIVTPLLLLDGVDMEEVINEKNKGIPILRINTNGVDIDSKDERIEGTMTIENSHTSNYHKNQLYSGKVGIRGRGNTSWNPDKKPYNIELWDPNNRGRAVGILGMPEEEDWLLIPNYFDKSLIRNYIAYDLSNKMGVYAPRARIVEVYVNDQYEGVYLLTERIKRGANRVNISQLTDNDIDQIEPNITGGYLLEVTPTSRLEDQNFFTTAKEEINLVYKYPRGENITPAQENYIQRYINDFEEALYSDTFDDPQVGYRKYIDLNSFIDWIIINELARNQDAAFDSSVFMYKDRGGRLFMGPVWDFDIAFGNINYNNGWLTDGWYITKSKWINRLFEDPYFAGEFIKRWQEVKPIIDEIPNTIDDIGLNIQEAADRNFERWDILGQYVWPNYPPYPETYEGELERLKTWIIDRTKWINDNIEELIP